MQSIEAGMRDGRQVAWKATCGYSFANGEPTSNDVVRSNFDTLNLFSFTTHGTFFRFLLTHAFNYSYLQFSGLNL